VSLEQEKESLSSKLIFLKTQTYAILITIFSSITTQILSSDGGTEEEERRRAHEGISQVIGTRVPIAIGMTAMSFRFGSGFNEKI
jgi:hypothetical protein